MKKHKNKFLIPLLIICINLFYSATSVAEQSNHIVSSNGPKDKKELTRFLNTWINNWNAENQSSNSALGLSIAIVSEGKVLTSQGYGFADNKKQNTVAADSVFRIASVSKVFVGMAVAQMVEQGLVQLDVDIKNYLPNLSIRNPFKTAITLRHLLSHTAGFDQQFWHDLTLDPNELQPLGEHLAEMLPPVIREPGKMNAYSNYGYALAGYLVEKISGKPFAEYVRENILKPLKMHNSDYYLNQRTANKLVTGYKKEQQKPYTYVHRYPPTSIMTSANDMSHLIQAIVNKGEYEDKNIFGDQAYQLITQSLFTVDTTMPGMTSGFMQWNRWDHKIIWHDGQHPGFSAELMLFPELKSGFFISVNSQSSSLARELKYALLNRYYQPSKLKKIHGPFKKLTDHSALVGEYIHSRRGHNNIAKFYKLLFPGKKITLNDNGTISMSGVPLAEVSPDLFAYIERPDLKLKVIRNQKGDVDYIAFGNSFSIYENLTGIDNFILHRIILTVLLIVFLTVSIYWLFQRVKNRKSAATVVLSNKLKLSSLFAFPAFLNLIFSLIFLTRMATIDKLNLRMGEEPLLIAILCLPFIILTIFVVTHYRATKLLRDLNLNIKAIIICSIMILCQILFFAELFYWNILGFQLIS